MMTEVTRPQIEAASGEDLDWIGVELGAARHPMADGTMPSDAVFRPTLMTALYMSIARRLEAEFIIKVMESAPAARTRFGLAVAERALDAMPHDADLARRLEALSRERREQLPHCVALVTHRDGEVGLQEWKGRASASPTLHHPASVLPGSVLVMDPTYSNLFSVARVWTWRRDPRAAFEYADRWERERFGDAEASYVSWSFATEEGHTMEMALYIDSAADVERSLGLLAHDAHGDATTPGLLRWICARIQRVTRYTSSEMDGIGERLLSLFYDAEWKRWDTMLTLGMPTPRDVGDQSAGVDIDPIVTQYLRDSIAQWCSPYDTEQRPIKSAHVSIGPAGPGWSNVLRGIPDPAKERSGHAVVANAGVVEAYRAGWGDSVLSTILPIVRQMNAEWKRWDTMITSGEVQATGHTTEIVVEHRIVDDLKELNDSIQRSIMDALKRPPQPWPEASGRSRGTHDDIRAAALSVPGVLSVLEVVTVEPGLVGVTALIDGAVNNAAKAREVWRACQHEAALGVRVVLREPTGEQWSDFAELGKCRRFLIRESLAERARARQLTVQGDCDPDTDNFGDAPTCTRCGGDHETETCSVGGEAAQ